MNISETPRESLAPYFFVLPHGYEESERTASPVH